jgi:hypothetical protein
MSMCVVRLLGRCSVTKEDKSFLQVRNTHQRTACASITLSLSFENSLLRLECPRVSAYADAEESLYCGMSLRPLIKSHHSGCFIQDHVDNFAVFHRG